MGTSSPWFVCTEDDSSKDSVREDKVSVFVFEILGDEGRP